MSTRVLVSPDGTFRPDALPGPAHSHGATTTVVAAVGARSVAQSSLLNAVLGTSLSVSRGPGHHGTRGVGVALHAGDASAAQARAPRRLVVLDVEGYDGNDRTREEARDRAANLAVALADVVMFSVRMNDLSRGESNGMAAMRIGLTEMLKLQDVGLVRPPAEKRCFLVVVRDYDAEDLPREDLINGFLKEMQTIYDSVSKPPRVPSRITDLFEFEFVTLPSALLAPEAFDEQQGILAERLTDPFADDYLFEGGTYQNPGEVPLPRLAASLWEALEEEQTRDLPPSKELMSTFACGAVMRKVFDKYQRGMREWERDTDDGHVIDGFGDAASQLMRSTLVVYDQDATPHRASKAFLRKRDELKEKMDAHMYDLFTRQALKLREVSYGIFKEKIEQLSSDDPGFERSINKAVKDAQKYFQSEAEKLRPRGSSWRFDNESKELASHMREDATERLQQARLEDYTTDARGRRGRRGGRRGRAPGAPSRQPISISFHYLNPAPFGFKDSRNERMSTSDNLELKDNLPDIATPNEAGSSSILPGKNEPWDRDFVYTEKLGGGEAR